MEFSKQTAHEKANAQIKFLTKLVKSVLKTMEQGAEEHANQLESTHEEN